MLVRADGLCIGQASHAWLAGQIAREWAEGFARHEEVCLAAEQHDVGMAEWDRTPTLDIATGLPTPFTQLPAETRLELWSAAPGKLLSTSRYAALLVSLHGTGLVQRFGPRPEDADFVRVYVEEQRALQARLIAQTGADEAELGTARRLIAVWDELSLGLCLGWDPVPWLEPWPFRADAVELWCEGRRPAGRCTAAAELHAALDAAPSETLRFALRRSTPRGV